MEMTYRFKENKNDVLYLTVKRLPLVLLVVALAFFCGQPSAMAQGTSVVSPNSANITALTLLPSNGSGSYLGCPVDNRIYFNIASSGTENLYYGFN